MVSARINFITSNPLVLFVLESIISACRLMSELKRLNKSIKKSSRNRKGNHIENSPWYFLTIVVSTLTSVASMSSVECEGVLSLVIALTFKEQAYEGPRQFQPLIPVVILQGEVTNNWRQSVGTGSLSGAGVRIPVELMKRTHNTARDQPMGRCTRDKTLC